MRSPTRLSRISLLKVEELHNHAWIFRFDGASNGSDRVRPDVGGNHHRVPRTLRFHRELCGRNEGDGWRVFAEVVVPGIGNGANDLIGALRIPEAPA